MTDLSAMLLETVVITNDCSSADICVFAHARIANVRQVADLDAGSQAALLNLDEIADFAPLTYFASGTHTCKRADLRIAPDVHTFQM